MRLDIGDLRPKGPQSWKQATLKSRGLDPMEPRILQRNPKFHFRKEKTSLNIKL